MKDITGFCGQSKIVEVPDSYNEEEAQVEANNEATWQCRCKEAKEVRAEQERKERIQAAKLSAQGTAFELFHEDAEEVEIFINDAIERFGEGQGDLVKKIGFALSGGAKAAVAFSDGKITVSRVNTQNIKRETEIL